MRLKDVHGFWNKVEWILLRLFAVAAVCAMTGCLSVARIPIAELTVRDAESGEIIEQRVDSAVGHVVDRVGVYPTLKMRWAVLKLCVTGVSDSCFESGTEDRPPTVGQRVGGVMATVGTLIGLPLDLVVDTICAYHDASRHSSYRSKGERK